jgi:hypothetical protein
MKRWIYVENINSSKMNTRWIYVENIPHQNLLKMNTRWSYAEKWDVQRWTQDEFMLKNIPYQRWKRDELMLKILSFKYEHKMKLCWKYSISKMSTRWIYVEKKLHLVWRWEDILRLIKRIKEILDDMTSINQLKNHQTFIKYNRYFNQ